MSRYTPFVIIMKPDPTAEILRDLAQPDLDTLRIFLIGRRLFADGGIVALERVIDAAHHRLGDDATAELATIWTPIIGGHGDVLAA